MGVITAPLVAGCGKTAETSTPADDAKTEDVLVADSAKDDSSRPEDAVTDLGFDAGDAESCPDPDFPPRADGCPCKPQAAGTCNDASAGTTCIYRGLCPGAPLGYTCVLKRRFEESPDWEWQACKASCTSDECPLPDDAGIVDTGSSGG